MSLLVSAKVIVWAITPSHAEPCHISLDTIDHTKIPMDCVPLGNKSSLKRLFSDLIYWHGQ